MGTTNPTAKCRGGSREAVGSGECVDAVGVVLFRVKKEKEIEWQGTTDSKGRGVTRMCRVTRGRSEGSAPRVVAVEVGKNAERCVKAGAKRKANTNSRREVRV